MTNRVSRELRIERDGPPPSLTSAHFVANARNLHRAAKSACGGEMPDLLALVIQGDRFGEKFRRGVIPMASSLVVGDGRAHLTACVMLLGELVKSGQANDPRVETSREMLAGLLREGMGR